jgi:hypothetical protein
VICAEALVALHIYLFAFLAHVRVFVRVMLAAALDIAVTIPAPLLQRLSLQIQMFLEMLSAVVANQMQERLNLSVFADCPL